MMIKNKLDYKLVNITLIIFSVFLIYQTKDFWVGLLSLFLNITLPFFSLCGFSFCSKAYE